MKLSTPLFAMVILSLVLANTNVQAQQADILNQAITWNSSHSVILNSSTELTLNCSIITRPVENEILLDQGGRTNEFVITGHQGTWTSVTENGLNVFSVTYDDQNVSISLEKNEAETFVIIDMSQNGSGIKRKIIVDQIITEK